MPTQADFEQAARTFRTTRDGLGAPLTALEQASGAPTMSGGSIAPVVQTGLDVSIGNTRSAVDALDALAVLCDRRAGVCADHAAALGHWHRRREHWDAAAQRRRTDPTAPDPGPPPLRPVAPHAWVLPQ
jgi:hypothetical protein